MATTTTGLFCWFILIALVVAVGHVSTGRLSGEIWMGVGGRSVNGPLITVIA